MLTPLPLAPRAPLAPVASSKKLFFEYSFVNLTHFSVKDVQFSIKLLMWPRGRPKRAKGRPRVGQRDPKAPKGRPKDAQREPKGSPKSQNGGQSRPRGRQGRSQGTQRRPKEAKGKDIYQKTPDQPPKRTLCYCIKNFACGGGTLIRSLCN